MKTTTDTLDRARLPGHVAIIMDGNRRWARSRGLPAVAGHKKGVEAVHTVVKAASDAGIKALTLYAFSTENWSRSKLEIKALMFLLEQAITSYADELNREKVRLVISGRLDALSANAREKIDQTTRKLSGNTGMTLNVAINYGGRQEILDAVNTALSSGVKSVDEKSFSALLYTPALPDPDLLIRTSGERRISNFLLWQTAYSEFYVTDTLWPDFGAKEFTRALLDYQARERRRGA
ncbi:MAG: di-trans,poly-cis-decaprenylcistransferase [Elusimicrobia bacterium GWF2_52_66]|nr:MAG: di-trans,poly-cis-decaprenylcistransferase [Elusimicrobia bacterium GWA2_51_34]OGR85781.1 MAG: di-trans,poly-cis-decaprenylcistransferase [Elusimicrobia bacterium GWF2_52_66]HAF96260.1 di-trans,poly-cis-decaprenylcistransferase [Elusimicrobiota bacterium]HCE97450.1 di-trans,poly-cis-decaprenylcistransferase [Elusimicrobiota bacterium]